MTIGRLNPLPHKIFTRPKNGPKLVKLHWSHIMCANRSIIHQTVHQISFRRFKVLKTIAFQIKYPSVDLLFI